MRLRRLAKIAVAAAPLIIGSASPAYGCLVLPENQGTQTAAQKGAFNCGPVGCGPDAPFDALHDAADRNQGQGFTCDPMCIAGNPDKRGGPNP